MPCVIKFDHRDGKKLSPSEVELWCDKRWDGFSWVLSDAQHAALADKPICNQCKSRIIKAIKGG